MEEEIPLNIKPNPAEQRAPLKGPWSAEKERTKEEWMETDLTHSEYKYMKVRETYTSLKPHKNNTYTGHEIRID
jgi:hypothetical protein